ncbi:Ankyrin repeat and SAM domain-containing protein 1A [Papilio xuthus]|uniref:Ankyrin repeat and SAM domain-containing protein 1A n=1 Tax=Papilio xuthus TaxID=66420 RepID=A0A194PXW8_PAPXU|nr:Ankyrin repeat and SAM domain-containing protein 1A [Papilio xuthus]
MSKDSGTNSRCVSRDECTVKCCGRNLAFNVSDVKLQIQRNWIKTKKFTAKMFDIDSLRRGAGVNVQDDNGYTPLHHACLRGHKDIVQVLLSVDALPTVVDKKGATPLHLAAWKGDSDIVSMLLEHKNPPINIDQRTSNQETALLIAAQSGYVDVVAQLLSRGADAELRNIKDESALDLAAQYGRLETVLHMLRVRPLLVHPYKYPNTREHIFQSSTPLHRASKNGHKEVVIALLEAGFDPNVRSYSGTPLHEAACFGKASVVRALLEKGADLHAVNNKGMTVDRLLLEYSGEASKRVRRVIREYESMACNYHESEEDMPPFPVQGYSPTGYPASSHMSHNKLSSAIAHCMSPAPNIFKSNPRVSNTLHIDSLRQAGNPYAVNNYNNETNLYENVGHDMVQESIDRTVLYENVDSKRSHTPNPIAHKASFKLPNENNLATNISKDRKAPVTQKNTNKTESLFSSSSSLTKNTQPQSFVKKLASKCLGLKAKFNSAPNISNNSGLESETDAKSKQSESDIICNDEFDTISLDRLGTLNRDSSVNRSNRSCPGFKTSLPNISENNEVSDSQESIVDCSTAVDENYENNDSFTSPPTEAVNYDAKLSSIFEPRALLNRKSLISTTSLESATLINECYESYEFSSKNSILYIEPITNFNKTAQLPKPTPRSNNVNVKDNDETMYENLVIENKQSRPTPAIRTHIPPKILQDDSEQRPLYENISITRERRLPEVPKRNIIQERSNNTSPNISRSSTLSSDSMIDESNLEDILLSTKSKSFRHSKMSVIDSNTNKSKFQRTMSDSSDSSNHTEASALENVDCTDDANDKSMRLSMTGTLPNKKTAGDGRKKVLFRHKTFTNIELDRNSTNIRDLPKWSSTILKDTLPNYHIKGTGHCIYKAPTVQEFIDIFNRETLFKDNHPLTTTQPSSDKRDSYFETAICFCKPKRPKNHASAEDLLEINQVEDEEVIIDMEDFRNKMELRSSSFRCFCVSKNCKMHDDQRRNNIDFVIKFSAIKRSLSTPDITLETSPISTVQKTRLTKIKSFPSNLEEPYASGKIEETVANHCANTIDNTPLYSSPSYVTMSSHTSTSSSYERYSVKDIAEVISIGSHTTSADTNPQASDTVHLPPRQSSSSEHSGHWSLQSCNSNVTVKSDASFKTCLEESSEEDSDDNSHSDEEISDAETVKSDISTTKRPWVHSDSFKFGSRDSKVKIEAILEDSEHNLESKCESGISVASSESSSSGYEDDSGVPRVDSDVLDCASLERLRGTGGVCSGSGRRRWEEAEGTSEGDALSVSSAASSCAPLHLVHHQDYSKVSPTPPKKPPRRNLSVSPTHANSPSSGYSYELRAHARSQDDLDEIQGAKHYLKHGRSVDQYVDGKLSYAEYEENHNSPRVIPIPNPRPSLKNRSQPVAITAMYENVVIKEQNPRRKLRRNNFPPSYENIEIRMNDTRSRKFSNQERSSLESLLDDQSMNSPSECERYYDRHKATIPLSPTHYDQPPTPDHPPPSAKQAENSIHERIRPLSQLIMEVVEEIRIRKKSQGDVTNS